MNLTCFTAYDIRGRVPQELDVDVSYRLGRAFAEYLNAKTVVVGHDIRLTSEALTNALVAGLNDAGADVVHIGLCGTEEVYFSTFDLGVCGGVCVTASHNPVDYNGMKLVSKGARPVSAESGLFDIKALAESGGFADVLVSGRVSLQCMRERYISHLMRYVNIENLKPLRILVNPGNGGAGLVLDALETLLPFEFVKFHYQPDGDFPNGIPNPLLHENQGVTAKAVVDVGADLGVAWDGDFDRCFFFDENGRFIEGYYIVGLLAEAFLSKQPMAKIVHDPRMTWNTVDIVRESGGQAIQSKTGHVFMKERMRAEDAVYGGEMSAHHYFRDFAYCDNGMIPWLLLTELMCVKGLSLSEMVQSRIDSFPCSGELNRAVGSPDALLAEVKRVYGSSALSVDLTDGLSMEFSAWRFNLRCSSTEPVVRLNVESRGDRALMQEKANELLGLMEEFADS